MIKTLFSKFRKHTPEQIKTVCEPEQNKTGYATVTVKGTDAKTHGRIICYKDDCIHFRLDNDKLMFINPDKITIEYDGRE